jgi:hypothetical protein
MACGETMIGNERRSLGIGYSEFGIFYSFAIKRTEVATRRRRGPLPRTKCLLTTDIDRQFGFQFTVGCSQEAGEAAKMIVVTDRWPLGCADKARPDCFVSQVSVACDGGSRCSFCTYSSVSLRLLASRAGVPSLRGRGISVWLQLTLN